jgi:hypothetical protein
VSSKFKADCTLIAASLTTEKEAAPHYHLLEHRVRSSHRQLAVSRPLHSRHSSPSRCVSAPRRPFLSARIFAIGHSPSTSFAPAPSFCFSVPSPSFCIGAWYAWVTGTSYFSPSRWVRHHPSLMHLEHSSQHYSFLMPFGNSPFVMSFPFSPKCPWNAPYGIFAPFGQVGFESLQITLRNTNSM